MVWCCLVLLCLENLFLRLVDVILWDMVEIYCEWFGYLFEWKLKGED